MSTFMWNKVTVKEVKKLLQDGSTGCVQIYETSATNPVDALDQQTTGNFFGLEADAAPQSPACRLPMMFTAVAKPAQYPEAQASGLRWQSAVGS